MTLVEYLVHDVGGVGHVQADVGQNVEDARETLNEMFVNMSK